MKSRVVQGLLLIVNTANLLTPFFSEKFGVINTILNQPADRFTNRPEIIEFQVVLSLIFNSLKETNN